MLFTANLFTVLFLFANYTFAYVRFSREVQYSPLKNYPKILAKACELEHPDYDSWNEIWRGTYSYDDYVIPLENDTYLGTIIYDCNYPDQFNETKAIKVMTFNSTVVYDANIFPGKTYEDLCHWKSHFFFKAIQSTNDPDTLCMDNGHQIQYDTKNGSYDPNFGCNAGLDSKTHIPKLCFKKPQIDPPKLLIPPTSSTESDTVPPNSFDIPETVPPETVPVTVPTQTTPPKPTPPETVPPETVPPDTVPPDTVPPETVPPDTVHPDTVPPETVPPDTVPPDTVPPVYSIPPVTISSILPTSFESLFPPVSSDPPETTPSTSFPQPELVIPPVPSSPTNPTDPPSISSISHIATPHTTFISSDPVILPTSSSSLLKFTSKSVLFSTSPSSMPLISTSFQTSKQVLSTPYTLEQIISTLLSSEVLSSSTRFSSVHTPSIRTFFSTIKESSVLTFPSSSINLHSVLSFNSSENRSVVIPVTTTLISSIYTTDTIVCTTTETIPITSTITILTTIANTKITNISLIFTTSSTKTATFTTTTTYCITDTVQSSQISETSILSLTTSSAGTQATNKVNYTPTTISTATKVEPIELSFSTPVTLPLNNVSIYIAGTERNYPVGGIFLLLAIPFF